MMFLWLFLALCFSFISSVFIFPYFIKKIGHFFHQPIRLDGPQEHVITKQKRPTMGGALLIGLILFWTLFFGFLWPQKFLDFPLGCSLFILLFFGAIGLRDDILKIIHQHSGGLSPKKKLLTQAIGSFIAMLFLFFLYNKNNFFILPHEISQIHGNIFSVISEPFISLWWNIYIMVKNYCPIIVFFYPYLYFFIGFFYCFFVITGTCNGVNLTDGLDGLVSIPLIISYGFIGYMGWYFQLYSVGLISVIVIGNLLGFLWHNAYPGRLMMGDVGSLGLGGLLAFLFLLTRVELLLPLVGGIFVIESLSVIIQVLFFRRTGKRFFLMAPLHHHFEKKSWPENHVVVRFWIISLLLGSGGLFCFHMAQYFYP